MSRERTRPSDVILDLLRSARGRRQSAGRLIASGILFGFSENTMRVTLSRLLARGRIESPARGEYRLSPRTDALNDFVERWRLGEDRVRPWTPGQWLFVHAPALDTAGRWALDALGFREIRAGLLSRPDNLTLDGEELHRLAVSIGLADDVLLIAGTARQAPSWDGCWDPEALNADYRRSLARLTESRERLTELPRDEARLECFTLGGEMIHRLAKDPLLPRQMIDASARQALWRAMLDYEAQGKRIWAGAAKDELKQMPRPRLAMSR